MPVQQNQYLTTSLHYVPIYRLLLVPESFLRSNNIGVSAKLLIQQLPNSQNINHIQELSFKQVEEHEKYYDNYLLIETKVFCRIMLKELAIKIASYETILLQNDWNKLVEIIGQYRLEFFKHLITFHLEQYGLEKGRIIHLISESISVEEVMKKLKAHQVLNKLAKSLINEMKMLYGIY